MHSSLRRLTALFAVLSLCAPFSAAAQAPTPNPFGSRSDDVPVGIYTPPAVFADTLTVQAGYTRTAINGSFVVLNNETETIGDLSYLVQLLGPLPPAINGEQVVADTAPMYDSFAATEIFALAPKSQKNVSFSYTPPAVPAGEYRLRVQVITTHGRELGWTDTSLSLSGEGLPYLQVAPVGLTAADYGDQVFPPLSGPNLNAGASLVVQAIAENTSTTAVSAIPVLNIYEFAATRTKVATEQLAALSFRPGERKTFDMPVTAAQKAEAYYATLHFESVNGERQSSIAEYRWVVRGVSGEILAAKLVKHGTKKTHVIQIDVDTVGAADAEASTTATLMAALHDEQGDVASVQSEPFALTPSLQQQTVTFELERDLLGTPSLELTLVDTNGMTLDTYMIEFPLLPEELAALAEKDNGALGTVAIATGNNTLLIAGGVLLLALLVMVLLYIRKNKNTVPPTSSGMTTMALVIASALMVTGLLAGHYQAAKAATGNGIMVKSANLVPQGYLADDVSPQQAGRWVEVFVNQPQHEGQYEPGQPVPLSYRVQWLGCKNQVNHTAVRIRYLAAGGKSSNYEGNWTTVDDRKFTDVGTCDDAPLIHNHYCRPQKTFTAANGVQLSALNQTARDTTLQFQAAFGTVTDNPSTRNCYFDCAGAQYALDAKNAIVHLWLNFLRPVSPTTSPASSAAPSVVPSPSSSASPSPAPKTQCADGIDNDNDGGRIDGNDPACHSDRNATNPASYNPALTSENDPQCSNNKDDDGDGVKDNNDHGCHTDANANTEAGYDPFDDNESNSQCSDGIDNEDFDTLEDSLDPACHIGNDINQPYDPTRTTENDPQCSDGRDNDNDSRTDSDDVGCRTTPGNPATYNPADNSETDPPLNPGDVHETE